MSNQVFAPQLNAVAAEYSSAGRGVLVVLPFKAARAEYTGSTCAGADASAATATPILLEDLTFSTAQQIASRSQVRVLTSARQAPTGAVVISGCVIKAVAGDARARFIGLGMGASELGVHVQVLRKTANGMSLIGEFDAAVRGSNKLPPIGPIGLIIHAKRAPQLTLAGDVNKLAERIAATVVPGS